MARRETISGTGEEGEEEWDEEEVEGLGDSAEKR
jgi:hypothetical protein